MTVSRLLPGVEIVTVPGRGLAVRTQDGAFLRIDTGEVAAEDLLARFGADGPVERSPALERLVEAFEEAGYARSVGGRRPLEGRTVFVLGDEPLTGALARRAAAEGADVQSVDAEQVAAMAEGGAGLADDADAGASAAVVWCLDAPVPVGLWDSADRLPGIGIGWLRCHREGLQAWVEPLASQPGDVTSRDVRLRRLAATPAHHELAAYWAGLRTPEADRAGTEASAALIAELLTADLVAWADGGRLPVRRRLRCLDLRDLTVTEHPVLPVPQVAPLSSPGGRRGAAK